MTGVSLQDGHGQAELPTPNSTHSYWHRDPSKKLLGHRTTKDLPPTADVVVIGSGITGTFAARELVAGGKGVAMLEAREACWGATGRVSLPSLHISHSAVKTSVHIDKMLTDLVVIEWRPLSAWRLGQPA